MSKMQPDDLITVADARKLLGVSHTKMSQLIKDGFIRCAPNLLDRREKLISKSEVLTLIPKRAEAA